MQLGEEPSVLEIASSPNKKPEMAVTATEPRPEAAAHEGVDGGDMTGVVDANNKSSEEGKGIKEGEGGGDEGEKINFGGNRWPRQETLALLKIRSDMDAVFRDSSLKGPLWEEVSRKLAELGYHRSAKKCKEKFENVYKYHKRTKGSRSNKPEGKTYRFFDQLQALENQFPVSNYTPKSQPHLPTTNTTTLLPTKPSDNSTTALSYVTTFPSTNNNNPTVISPSPPPPPPQTNATTNPRNPSSQENYNNNNVPNSLAPNMNLFSTTSTSNSSTASDEDLEERYRKKRKWKDYFRRLTRRVLKKQEEMQKRFLDVIDKRERERVAQQDAWRMQEMARINREHEILVQEHSTAAAKDAAVLAFLQKLSGNPQNPIQQPQLQPSPLLPQSQVESQQPQPQPQQQQIQQPLPLNNGHSSSAIQVSSSSSSSRWPKAEVLALIRLRTTLETKYQENGPKAPLWEDISAGMLRIGYNRSSKRCKEKWENINKYFKKVKESNRQRREGSKTCPYFFELDALYKEKSKTTHNVMNPNEMMMEPLMVQPEQQWRPPPQYHEQQPLVDKEREEEEEEGDDDDDGVEEGGDSVEDEGDNRYEIGTNKISSADTVE